MCAATSRREIAPAARRPLWRIVSCLRIIPSFLMEKPDEMGFRRRRLTRDLVQTPRAKMHGTRTEHGVRRIRSCTTHRLLGCLRSRSSRSACMRGRGSRTETQGDHSGLLDCGPRGTKSSGSASCVQSCPAITCLVYVTVNPHWSILNSLVAVVSGVAMTDCSLSSTCTSCFAWSDRNLFSAWSAAAPQK